MNKSIENNEKSDGLLFGSLIHLPISEVFPVNTGITSSTIENMSYIENASGSTWTTTNNVLIESESSTDPLLNKKEEKEELRALLVSFQQENLLDCLIEQNVYVNVLRMIKRHHIERLLKKFDMGTQITFEHNLEEWRQLMGIPLSDNISNSRADDSPRSTYTVMSSSPSCSRYSPYPSSPSPDPGNGISLSDILNESSKANMLAEYYKKFSKFQEEQRNSLISIIVNYFQDKGIIITISTSYRLEREILDRFPTEKLEFYRTNKRGKIYNKWRNSNFTFKTISGNMTPSSKSKKEKGKEKKIKKVFVAEEDAEVYLRSLQFDPLTAEEFDNCWRACSNYRLQEIMSLNTTKAILDKWPFYKQPSGYRLVDMDFKASFNNCDGLLKNWTLDAPKIISFMTDEHHIKDKNIRSILEKLQEQSVHENGRDAAILWCLHGYFVPTNKIVKKDSTGKNQTIKFTIRDSQESFLCLGKTAKDIEERIMTLKEKKTAIQPFIFAIGEDIFSITDIGLYFDEIKYKFFNIIRAVDICFKLFYLFNLDYPAESRMFWNFIESHFFKIEPSSNFSKVHILCQELMEK